MIISEQWLRDWVRVDLDAQGIADCLTNAGLEVDGVEPVAGLIDGLVVGQVTAVEKHPDADRLNLTKVDIGTEVLDIVCGASNVREGLIVAVATIGATLPNGLNIKKAKVRGIESSGMLCSASELGLEESSDGLIELESDAELGQRVDDYLQLDDKLIDVDLTPNRGDCLSIQGIARELNVLADGSYHPLDVELVAATSDANISIDLQDSDACPCYVGRVISGINPESITPLWMQERLRRSGIRPIRPVVDITNYVMLELGQPMHAFDLAKLNGSIVVRKSIKGEKITLLDDSETELDGDTLVIADSKGAIAIAGVMGGADSAIDDATTDIVLEAAHFTRKSSSGRARRYGLHTESSHRFERGVDPLLSPIAIERATELLLQICGGDAGEVVIEKNDDGLKNKPSVEIRLPRLISMLGMELEANEVGDILKRVADSVEQTETGWSVSPPSYRFDIECEADLVEEVARVKGYDAIPTAMPRIAPRSVVASEGKVNLRQVRQSMVARDYREAITYSFIDPNTHKLFSDEAPVVLANPLAENMSVMRTSLLPGLLGAVQFNSNRQHERIRLFEVGATYHKHEKVEGAQEHSSPYKEVQRLAGIITGPVVPVQWHKENARQVDFYDLKGDLEAVLALTGQKKPIIFNRFEHISLHPGQVSRLSGMVESDCIEFGWIGRLHPALLKQYGLTSNVYAFEVELDKALLAELPEFVSVSRFPSIKRDLSVLIDDSVSAENVMETVHKALGDSLVKMVIFDVYRGQGVADNQKSMSLSLVLRDVEKTMIDEEAEALMQAALVSLEKEFDAKLRG